MKITLPAGYEPPDGAKPGEPFEAVATLVMDKDGTYELTAIDGTPLDEAEAPAEMDMEMKSPYAEKREPKLPFGA